MMSPYCSRKPLNDISTFYRDPQVESSPRQASALRRGVQAIWVSCFNWAVSKWEIFQQNVLLVGTTMTNQYDI
jgi:hypothetical protein